MAAQGRTLLLGPCLGYVKHPFLGLLSPSSLDPGRCVPIPGVTCRPEKQIISSLPVRSPLPPFLQQALSDQIEDNSAVQWFFPAVLYFRCLADDCIFSTCGPNPPSTLPWLFLLYPSGAGART